MNDELIDLFEKQAAYEGVDLDGLSDEELAYVFNNFVENISDDDDEDVFDDGYEEEEAYEKLAEAEILGRHMARAYMDELEKEAKMNTSKPRKTAQGGRMLAIRDMMRAGMTRDEAVAAIEAGIKAGKKSAKKADKARLKARGKRIAQEQKKQQRLESMGTKGSADLNKAAPTVTRADRRREAVAKDIKGKYKSTASYIGKKRTALGELLGGTTRKAARLRGNIGLAGLGTAGAAGAYGLSQMGKEASYEAFELEALDRAMDFIEFGKEASYDDTSVDIRAVELLEEEGYDVSPLFDDSYDY